jgi:dTMP kinase
MSRFEFYGPGLPAVEAGELKGKLIVVEGADGVGRSTHITLLKEWFENTGHAVLDTGMTRSALAGKGLKVATNGNTLGRIAMSLFYATDFADRLENEIMPALRAGLVVITDRYIYSLMARAIVRGAEPHWIRDVYRFAPKPDIVIYLRANVDQLVRRVVQTTGFNYWESGMDLNLGDDMYDSFCEYQSRLLSVFDRMSGEYGFHVVETASPIEDVSDQIRNCLAPVLVSA